METDLYFLSSFSTSSFNICFISLSSHHTHTQTIYQVCPQNHHLDVYSGVYSGVCMHFMFQLFNDHECNACGKSVSPSLSNPLYRCHICNYDICTECRHLPPHAHATSEPEAQAEGKTARCAPAPEVKIEGARTRNFSSPLSMHG